MTAKTGQFDIAISGASFAGLALALAVARSFSGDLKVVLADRIPAPVSPLAPGPRAFAISAASRNLLTALGVWDKLASVAQPVTAIEITDSSLDAGIRPVVLTYDNHLEDGQPATHIVPAAALTSELYRAVASEPSVLLLAPAQVDGFTVSSNTASMTLSDGRNLTATLAVAAEGRQSALREAAQIKSVTWSYDQTGIVVVVAHDRPHGGRAVQHFLPAGPFAILPLVGNRSCITWTEESSEAARIMALDASGFFNEVDKRFGGRLGAITIEGAAQSWPLDLHLARSYVGPRLALIGDAAHTVHPIAGQGANLALRDVAALVEVIADGARLGLDIGSAPILERFEQWRRFDAATSALSFDALNRVFSNDSTVLRAARDAGLGLVDRWPALKRTFVSEASGLTGDLPRLLKGEPV